MVRIKRCILLMSFLAIFPICSHASIDQATVSFYAVRRDNGQVLLSQNCDLSVTSASCMKLVTTAAALRILGPDGRFETHLEHDGWIDDAGTLHGNIYIRGGGDPCLGSDRITGSHAWKQQLAIWADAIQKLGICRVKGKIIPDANRWEKALAAPGWSWEDLGNYYGVGASALSFHDNLYSVSFKPAEQLGGQTTILCTDPPLPSVTLHNDVKTRPEGSGDNAYIFGCEYFPTQFMRGTIPAGVDQFSIKGAVPDPGTLCAELLTQELGKRGVVMMGKDGEQGKRVSFHVTTSPTIREIVHYTNQKSFNLYAEHLLKRMGEKVYGEGSTAAGVRAVIDFWKAQNINLSGFHMLDGSGLSRGNLVTARQLVAILMEMEKSNYFQEFIKSLPEREGFMRAKDGYMSSMRGFTGYTDHLAFAVVVSQCVNVQARREMIKDFFLKLRELDKQ